VEAVESRPKARRRNIVLDQNLPYPLHSNVTDTAACRDLEKDWKLTVDRSSLLLGAALYLSEYVGDLFMEAKEKSSVPDIPWFKDLTMRALGKFKLAQFRRVVDYDITFQRNKN